jgi:glutathione peroxidase
MATQLPSLVVLAALAAGCSGAAGSVDTADGSARTPTAASAPQEIEPVYTIPLHTLEGQPTTLGEHKGEALLLVNVASECGLTPQYAGLQKLQERYGPRGLTVVGFPCNQFGGQEPGAADEIRAFCDARYGVTFPLMEKLEVNGPNRHPLYRELTAVADATGAAGDVQWNFEKFLISADGRIVGRFRPKTTPEDPARVAAIERELPAT